MVTTMTGYVIINESIFNRDMNTPGGSAIVMSQLLHEGLHLRQFDFLAEKERERPGGSYDLNSMEYDAYALQIFFLEERLKAETDPKKQELLREVIRRLKAFRDYYKVRRGLYRSKIKPSAFIDTAPWNNDNEVIFLNDPSNSSADRPDFAHLRVDGEPGGEQLLDSSYVLNSQIGVEDQLMFAGTSADVPLALARQILETLGTVPDYNLDLWTDQDYRGILGANLEEGWLATLAVVRSEPFNITANPLVVGQSLQNIQAGVAIFLVSSPTHDYQYGWDKNGEYVSTPRTPSMDASR